MSATICALLARMADSVNAELHIFRSARLESVALEAIDFLTKSQLYNLPPSSRFIGVGVYALYYLGDSEHYKHIVELNKANCVHPIYVGKAVPAGWRTARNPKTKNLGLLGRLREHTKSIEQGTGLDVADFRCRFIILQENEADLITAVEAQLIRLSMPIWNTLIDGFGNHTPGKRRFTQSLSEWDVLHPGRSWAEKLTGPRPSLETILKKLETHRQLSSSA